MDVTAPTLTAGQLVRVVLQAPPVAGAAAATRLTLIDTRLSDALRRLQLQGIVAQWDAAAGQFMLHGLTVQVNANTQFEDGTVADLGNGARVEVSGAFSSGQLLTADKLRIVRGMLNGYGRGRVTSVNVADKRFSLLELPGIEIRLRAGTLLNDTSLLGGLRLDNLEVGDEVLVLGRANGARIDAELVTRDRKSVV